MYGVNSVARIDRINRRHTGSNVGDGCRLSHGRHAIIGREAAECHLKLVAVRVTEKLGRHRVPEASDDPIKFFCPSSCDSISFFGYRIGIMLFRRGQKCSESYLYTTHFPWECGPGCRRTLHCPQPSLARDRAIAGGCADP